MRLKPIGDFFIVKVAGLLFGLALSLPVCAALAVDAQGLFSGNADDEILDAVADSSTGNVYVTGWTSSTTIGSQPVTIRGSRDVFVAKFDAAGTLLAVQVFGGGDQSSLVTDTNEQGASIALDAATGDVYVTGAVSGVNASAGKGLPTSIVDRGCRTFLTDAFLLVLQSDLTPTYFTCFGDLNVVTRGEDAGHAIAVDGQGDVFLGGTTITQGQYGGFPTTTGSYAQTSSNVSKNKDGFVLKLSNPLTSGQSATVGGGIVYSTYLGGGFDDEVLGLTIDGSGQAYVTGVTISADFPTTVLPLVATSVDYRTDAFFACLSADGSNLSLSGLVGGNDNDQGNAIALDAATGDVYVTGDTRSTDLGGTPAGGQDAFVARIANNGSLGYLVYLGTTGNDRGLGIVVDQGVAVVAGLAGAGGLSSPLSGFTDYGGDDGFVVRLNTAGIVTESAYIGTPAADRINSIRLTGAGHFVVAGDTSAGGTQDGFFDRLTHSSTSTGGNTGGGGTIKVTDPGTTPSPAGGGGGGGVLFLPTILAICLRRLWQVDRSE